jgi:antitoxin component YwqK of YwqJK toxin-antitoxin module
MNSSFCSWLSCCVCVVSLGIGSLALGQPPGATDADESSASDERVTAEGVVKPYTGPPIYLDEPPAAVLPTLVERKTVTDKYPSGEVRCERQVARFSDDHLEADGFYREYYKSGQLFAEGQYLRGRQQGDWTFYHENGTADRKVRFENGLPDGEVDVYRDDGTLAIKRVFAKGKRTGAWVTYDRTGKQPLREENYEDGEPNGLWKSYFSSGQLQREIPIKNGKRDGLAREWNADGSERGELSYVDGVLDGTTTIWMADGRKIVRTYKQGSLVSETLQ